MRTLQFLGAAGAVTGSKYLVTWGERRLLVDCGLFQGYKHLRLRNWAPLAIDNARLDAVILTHAHIDHSGALPILVKSGWRGPVYCSAGTRDLCEILLRDSARLQEEEAVWANQHGYSKHHPALPLYTEQDAADALRLLRPCTFASEVDMAGLRLRLVPAGHILGAAIAELFDDERRVAFSGDLGRPNDLIAIPPARIRTADTLVVESTEIAHIDNLSAHADADEILGWLRELARPPRRTYITHGEPAASEALRRRIERELGWSCHIPEYLESVPLD